MFYEKQGGIKTERDNKPEGKYTVLLKLRCVYMKLVRNSSHHVKAGLPQRRDKNIH